MKIKNLKLKIIFFGTPSFIEPVIETLKDNYDLIQINRTPVDFNEEKLNQIKNLAPDLFVVAAYGKILPKKLLDIPKLGAVNIHPSLLPKYRGPSPLQTAILNGDKTTGISIIKMDELMDHGPILMQSEEEIFPKDTFESLAERLFKKSAEMLNHVITSFNEIKPEIQDESKVSFTKLLAKEDGFLDSEIVNHQSLIINRMIRAYYPWPGVWTKFEVSANNQDKIIKLLPNEKVQVEGKNPMSYKDFKNGYKNGEDFLNKLNLS